MFHPLCYEGAVDLSSVGDLTEREALEVQIAEFGQVPQQVFMRPHPRRCLNLGLYDALYVTPILGAYLAQGPHVTAQPIPTSSVLVTEETRVTVQPAPVTDVLVTTSAPITSARVDEGIHIIGQPSCDETVDGYELVLSPSQFNSGTKCAVKLHEPSESSVQSCDIHVSVCESCTKESLSCNSGGKNRNRCDTDSDTCSNSNNTQSLLSDDQCRCSRSVIYDPVSQEKFLSFCLKSYLCQTCRRTSTHNKSNSYNNNISNNNNTSAWHFDPCDLCHNTSCGQQQQLCARWNCKMKMCPCTCGTHIPLIECPPLLPVPPGGTCAQSFLPLDNKNQPCDAQLDSNEAPFELNKSPTKSLEDVNEAEPDSPGVYSGNTDSSTESTYPTDTEVKPTTSWELPSDASSPSRRCMSDSSDKLPPLTIPEIRLQEDIAPAVKEGSSKLQELITIIKSSTALRPKSGKAAGVPQIAEIDRRNWGDG